MTKFIPALGLCLLFGASLEAADLLRLEFNDNAHLAAQPAPLPEGVPQAPLKASAEFPGAADFTPPSLVRIPAFHAPKGPFSIEARFRLRAYGPESSRFIADIINTATWDTGPTQGFVLRAGGSYLYPPLPSEAYQSDTAWNMSQEAWSHIDRGILSDCFAAFVIARADDARNWKTIYTDRCLELNAWTHLVATWDGEDMRIYLDGVEATDKWRVQGKGHAPLIDSVADAYVGSRITGEYDPRHLNGVLDFVRVEDGALSPDSIHQRFQETFKPEQRDSLCMGVIIPHLPEAGQVCDGGSFEIKVVNHGACTDTAFVAGLLAGDSVEIEFATNPSFTNVVLRVKASKTLIELNPEEKASLSAYAGEIWWRARLLHRPQGLAKGAAAIAAIPGAWSLSRPVVLSASGAGVRRERGEPRMLRRGFFFPDVGRGVPAVFDLAGKRQDLRFRRVTGGWRLDSDPAPGLLLLRR